MQVHSDKDELCTHEGRLAETFLPYCDPHSLRLW